MDELNYFMGDMHISQNMRVRAREYFRNTCELRKKPNLSPHPNPHPNPHPHPHPYPYPNQA